VSKQPDTSPASGAVSPAPSVALSDLLPKAVAWAETHAKYILVQGRPLATAELSLATAVEVHRPELIRVSFVAQLPVPDDAQLARAAQQAGLLGRRMVGLTLGYGIYLVMGHATPRILSHECRHVHQYEVAGSIKAFVAQYLEQIVRVGYARAPFEVDARNWERDHA
jgi:hypothetical protein